jgi:cytoskeletal protein CcmA (bactofilin family)
MDPSKLQSDADNDVNSLEGNETSLESGNTPSTAGGPISASPSSNNRTPQTKKPPIWRRIWRHMNIYLLLFLLVLITGAAITWIMVMRYRAEQPKIEDVIDSQTLSDEALKQLANGSATIGNSQQILNVESNAVFSGTVLVRRNLEVAGTIKVGGDIALPGLTVSGNSRFGQVAADTLTIGGATNIQGPFTATKGINVTGNSSFNGTLSASQISTNSLQLGGDLTLTRHITAGGPIPNLSRGNALGSGGTASVSGSDTAGSIAINTGSSPGAGCFATVTFVRAYANTPHIAVTPIGSGAAGLEWYVNRSTGNFSVCTTNPAGGGQSFGFDYVIMG